MKTAGISLVLLPCIIAFSGCAFKSDVASRECVRPRNFATRIDRPAICSEPEATNLSTIEPRTLRTEPPTEADFEELTLEQAIYIALQNGSVLRDLGGRLLSSPEASRSVYDPAIVESDPQFGVEGALSAFDAQLSSGLFWQKNDRVFNNRVQGGGINEFQQDAASHQTELSKTTATGTRFSLGNLTQFDANNSPLTQNMFPESWNTEIEATIRQPLMQGAGVAFNRIAGPNAQPGFSTRSGVVIARIRTDVALADFEMAVRDFISDVENAYWELYFAYRAFDAAALALDSSLETWRGVKARYDQNLKGGEAYKEARARSQYHLFQNRVQNALNGPARGVGSVGVYAGERQLRWILGLPTTSEKVLRPVDAPPAARVVFDWDQSIDEALFRRVELRKQMWQVKRQELQVLAAKNFTRPRLDAVANYRVRGFGNRLGGPSPQRFSTALGDLGTLDHQEWEAGIQLDLPVGLRQGFAGVRQAQLQLARERAILESQQHRIALQLSDAVAESERAYQALQTGRERIDAASDDVGATLAAYKNDQASVELLLDSQQRMADAQNAYFRTEADYAIALKEVHRQKGSLFQYNEVSLSEGSWRGVAYTDAAKLAKKWVLARNRKGMTQTSVVSRGAHPQRMEYASSSSGGIPTDLPSPIEDQAMEPVELDEAELAIEQVRAFPPEPVPRD